MVTCTGDGEHAPESEVKLVHPSEWNTGSAEDRVSMPMLCNGNPTVSGQLILQFMMDENHSRPWK